MKGESKVKRTETIIVEPKPEHDIKVSILMPAKISTEEQKRYFFEAIQSVVDQGYTNWELIIIDDHSESRLNGVKRKFNRYPNIVWYAAEKTGVGNAKNQAARLAMGRLLLPLDADDKLWEPDTLESMVAHWKSNPGVVYADLHMFGRDVDRIWICKEWNCNGLIQDVFMWNTSLFSKEHFDAVGGYDVDLDFFEDWDLWVKFVEHDICGYHLNRVLLGYRQRPDSRMAILRQNADGYNAALSKMRIKHVNFFEGRLRSMCCEQPQGPRAPRGIQEQTPPQLVGDRVLIIYTGNMGASFFVEGKTSHIKYNVPGRGEYLNTVPDGTPGVDPRDVSELLARHNGLDFKLA